MPVVETYNPGRNIRSSAEISDCGRYRWWLRRAFGPTDNGRRSVCFVMLNPSTADGTKDDPTIRRCIGFAKAWGFGELWVRNLFPYRATNKRELINVDNPCGDPRGLSELAEAHKADLIIAAWGGWVPFRRDQTMKEIYRRGRPIYCLQKNEDGSPAHPLYMSADLEPQPFWNCPTFRAFVVNHQ